MRMMTGMITLDRFILPDKKYLELINSGKEGYKVIKNEFRGRESDLQWLLAGFMQYNHLSVSWVFCFSYKLDCQLSRCL